MKIKRCMDRVEHTARLYSDGSIGDLASADDFNGVRLLFLACVMAEGQEIEGLTPRQYCVLIQQEEGIGQALRFFPSTNHTLRSHDEREKVVKIRIGGLGVVVEFPQCV